MRRWCATVVLVGLVGLAGCGGGGTGDVGSASRRDPESAPAERAAPAVGEQVVRYQGLELTVPASWPVHDLAAAPTTCVRFDVNAVYLGAPSPAMECPAQLIGRADAVLVEAGPVPTGEARSEVPETPTTDVNGLAVAVDESLVVEHQLVASVPQVAVTLTLSFGETDEVARRIITTLRAAQ